MAVYLLFPTLVEREVKVTAKVTALYRRLFELSLFNNLWSLLPNSVGESEKYELHPMARKTGKLYIT